MLTFREGEKRFNYRVAGVILSRGRVLLQSAEDIDFWVLPGGRAEWMEEAAASIRRELREEIGVEPEVERLLWLVENFFEMGDGRWHEIGLYFLLRLPDESPLHDQDAPFYGDEVSAGGEPIKIVYRWFDLAELEQVKLYPTFLRAGLRAVPETIQHLVVVDD